jgi:hypothetical protein
MILHGTAHNQNTRYSTYLFHSIVYDTDLNNVVAILVLS